MVWTIANTLTIVFIARAVPGATPAEVNTYGDGVARRRDDLGLPRDHLRVHDRDRRLGAVGRDDRVHVHGAAVASRPPVRAGRVRGALRADPGLDPLLRGRRVHRHPRAGGELRGGARAARARVTVVHRRRDHDVGAAADLAGEGRAARLRLPGRDARGLGRLLPGQRHAGVDAVDLEDLAGDVRAARLPQRRSSTAPAWSGRTSGRC